MNPSPETKQPSSVKPGDVVRLGDHVLICGDAAKIDLAAALQGSRIGAIVCDPPYAVNLVESKRGLQELSVNKDILNDGFMSDPEYVAFTKSWLAPALPHLAKKNSIYIFNSDKMVFSLRQAFLDLGIKVSQMLIWIKQSAVLGRLDYMPQHELILYGWFGTHDFRRSKDKSVLFYPRPSKSVLHPSMKPPGLLRKLILNSTKIGDIVYDPMGGSGSLLIACEQTKRRCVIVEIDPAYCEIIVKRWQKLTHHGTD